MHYFPCTSPTPYVLRRFSVFVMGLFDIGGMMELSVVVAVVVWLSCLI